ncbi:DUF3618 domain-containing protein [Georgenia sp. MJ170]|uniref:DUF3618 domain-containing protein n=1 Tax=Georgenia sunbinii TaxID=3117728 RepID=UPI002F26225E
MSTNDPDAIRRDIERTRTDLSEDVDALTDRVSPGNIAQRQGDKVRDAVSGAKDRVFGSASDASDTVRDQADRATDAAREAPQRVKRTAEGNPLAAGLIAFGAGLLAAGLIPSSSKERELVKQAKESDAVAQVTDDVKGAAKESAEHLKEPAQQAADDLKATATESVNRVKGEGQDAAQDVRGQAQDAAQNVKDSRG